MAMKKYVEYEEDGIKYNLSIIEAHPRKKEIERDLINRMPYSEVARKYGITVKEASKYFKKTLVPQLAKVLHKERKENVDMILRKLNKVAEKSNKLLEACDLWLTDPENKEVYNLEPRASEIEVIYNELVDTGDGVKKIRKKDTLQRLINLIKGRNYEVTRITTKVADPRDLILKTSAEIREELKLIAQITGDLGNHETEVNINLISNTISNAIIDSTEKDYKTRDRLIRRLKGAIEEVEHSQIQ